MVVVSHHVPAPPQIVKAATTPRAAAASSKSVDATGVITLRPQTAPSAQRFDKRRHQAFVKQLQSTLLAARLETPPLGVSRSEIDRRISILERMIEDVEKMSLEAAAQQEAIYNARYVSAERNRLRREETIFKSNQQSDRRHTDNHENHRDEELLLLRHRRRTTEHRTHKCHDALEDRAIEKFQRGVAASQRREEHLRELEEKRKAAVADHIRLCRQREGHCQDVLAKKEERDDAVYQEKVDAAEAHRKEAEARLKRLADERARSASARARKIQETAERGRTARVSVDLYHAAAPKLDVTLKPFDIRLSESNAKEARRSQRYDEEHRVRNEYSHFKTIRFEDRRQSVENRQEEISRERLQQGYKVSELAHRKLFVGDAVHAKRRAESDAALERKARDVQAHLERAEQIEENRIDSIRRKRFNRWSGRQEVMADLVFSEYLALADDAVVRDRRHANTKAGGGEDGVLCVVPEIHDISSRKESLAVSPTSLPLQPSGSHSSVKRSSPARQAHAESFTIPSPRRGVNTNATLSADRRHQTISGALSK
jgi:hypothetical protein